MWNRKELKTNAKKRFTLNYWTCVFAALILLVVSGGGPTLSFKFDGSDISRLMKGGTGVGGPALVIGDADDMSEVAEDLHEAAEDVKEAMSEAGISESSIESFINNIVSSISTADYARLWTILAPVFIILLFAALIAAAVGICVKVFLLNPLFTGCKRFFMKNHNEKATIGNVGFAFGPGYLNVVKVSFLMNLFTLLWSLLFIIPGIVKSYEYRMIPYLLAENPEIDRAEAFARSKEMMSGNKWRAFVLDLSFIGWGILSALTFGLLGLFYVNPYMFQTEAELFYTLKGNTISESNEQDGTYESYVEV